MQMFLLNDVLYYCNFSGYLLTFNYKGIWELIWIVIDSASNCFWYSFDILKKIVIVWEVFYYWKSFIWITANLTVDHYGFSHFYIIYVWFSIEIIFSRKEMKMLCNVGDQKLNKKKLLSHETYIMETQCVFAHGK